MEIYNIKTAVNINNVKLIKNLKDFVDEFDIQNVLVLDPLAVIEMHLLLSLKVKVYYDFDIIALKNAVGVLADRLLPVADLTEKADIIILPMSKKYGAQDIIDLRNKLHKDGLVIYKKHEFPDSAPLIVQYSFKDLAVMDVLTTENNLLKILINRKNTGYINQSFLEMLSANEANAAIAAAGFKKVLSCNETFEQEFEEFIYKYIIFKKEKKIVGEVVNEEDLPLMTTSQISDKFKDIMEDSGLSREDLDLI